MSNRVNSHSGWTILVKYRLGEANVPPSVSTLFVCPINTKHGTLAQDLSKALKILMMSSLSDVYDVIQQFPVSFEAYIRDSLSFVQFS